MALPRVTSAAAGPDDPVQCNRLRHAFEFVAAALLSHEQPRYLSLHSRRDYHRTRLGQCLRPRRDVRHVAEYFTRSVDHRWPQVDGDARSEGWFARASVLAVQFFQRSLNCERRPHGALGIVLLRHRIAKQRHQAVAELLGDLAAHFHDRRRGGVEICSN